MPPESSRVSLAILSACSSVMVTALQILKLSGTFEQPFGSERMVRERLQSLGAEGWVRSSYYAMAAQGAAPKYYFLTATGFAMLHGPDVLPVGKRSFAPLPVTRHRHSRALADFVVHTCVAAHASGARLANFYPENRLQLHVDGETFSPDGAFELHTPSGSQLNFVLEIDCGTERVISPHDVDSWQRKIRLYDRLQDLNHPHRFRVLVVCTGGRQRIDHILTAAKKLYRNAQRTLLCGVTLEAYLAQPDAVRVSVFSDHLQRRVALVPAL